MRVRFLVVLVSLPMLLAAGCSDQAPDERAQNQPSSDGDSIGSKQQSNNDPTGAPNIPAVSSGIEGAPIPKSSVPRSDLDDTWNVENMTYAELLAWYEVQMPIGEDFRSWEWCDTGGGNTLFSHIYAKGKRDILAVTMTKEEPPAVLIGRDKSGPC